MKVALIHDWLNGMRGGEYVLEAIAGLFPEAEIFALFCDPDKISEKITSHKIVTSFIQNLPLRKSYYRHYLPFFPAAIERFNFDGFDIAISSSHCVAKGAIPGKNTLHICYCHSPMRYVWDRFDDYFPRSGMNILKYGFIKMITDRLRKWDVKTANRVDLFVANSNFVKWRIGEYYRRSAAVIHPPVDTEFYTPGPSDKREYFITAGALVPYKKTEIIIEAFRNLDERLIVTGDGPDLKKLVNIAPDNVEFTGWLDREKLRDYYRGCKALIFAGIEDFGIIPVEVMACGRPVIAFNKGGLVDTVVGPSTDNFRGYNDFKSGLFFTEQTAPSIRHALDIFTIMEFDSDSISEHTQKFSKKDFSYSVREFISKAYDSFRDNGKAGLEERLIS
ncbi:MAG: glycosyltransferase [Candidatus Zixiibacteriota bacterium]|nr:MAG: glycosyltransferase [candidate division Zixibacteria bacterium]